MWKLITEAWRYRFVTENFVYMNLGLRYRRNILGYLWSILFPLLRYALLAIVFSYVMKTQDMKYFAHFFTGMVLFTLLASCFNSGTHAMVSNAQYIKRIYVPKLLFVINPIVYELFNTFLVFVGLLILGIFTGLYSPHWSQLSIFPSILIIVFFLIGCCALLGVAMVWFNDVQYLVDISMQTLMFITPIMFRPQSLPDFFYLYNPFYYLIEIVRIPLVERHLPDPVFYFVSLATALTAFFFGLWLLDKKQDKITFRI